MCEFLSVRQFAQSGATRHLQTRKYSKVYLNLKCQDIKNHMNVARRKLA